jgi:hypothetical protein
MAMQAESRVTDKDATTKVRMPKSGLASSVGYQSLLNKKSVMGFMLKNKGAPSANRCMVINPNITMEDVAAVRKKTLTACALNECAEGKEIFIVVLVIS